jgi:hypothetical protein
LNPFSQNFRTPIKNIKKTTLAILYFDVMRTNYFELIMMTPGWDEKWIGVGKH